MDDNHFYLGNDSKSKLATKNLENNYDFDESSYKYDENLKNDGHVAVIRQIKENSTVLDIGCASGILGSILTKYKKCEVDGIEYDKESAKIAKGKKIYRDVFNFSIADIEGKEYKNFENLNRKYDFIIFADVLEHLVEPWKALVNSSKMLNKNGKIIISLPNIAHLDIIKGLINHEFNYTKWGILDQTHLRFFTPMSFKDMIDNIALEYNVYFNVELVENILIKPPYFKDNEKYELFNMNSNLENYLALQNTYCLSIAKNMKSMSSNIKNNDSKNFDKMLKKYRDVCEANKRIIDDNILLKEEITRLESELNRIVNSKRWKLLNKLLRIIRK